jgi:hypothetical protein
MSTSHVARTPKTGGVYATVALLPNHAHEVTSARGLVCPRKKMNKKFAKGVSAPASHFASARQSNFKQSDIKRALKGALDAGLTVRGYKVGPDGIEVMVGKPEPQADPQTVAGWRASRDSC